MHNFTCLLTVQVLHLGVASGGLVHAISALVNIDRRRIASETQLGQLGVNGLLVLRVESGWVSGEHEKSGGKAVGHNRPIVVSAGVHRAKLENPVRSGIRGSVGAFKNDFKLARISVRVSLVAISVDGVWATSRTADGGVVVHAEGAIAVVTVDSSGTERILLERGKDNLVSGHLIPETQVLWHIQGSNCVRIHFAGTKIGSEDCGSHCQESTEDRKHHF